jgi:hypothetical protein
MQTYIFAVQVNIGSLTYPFKFDKNFLPFFRNRYFEMLTIPNNGIGQLSYMHTKSFVFVESMRQCNSFPFTIIEYRVFGTFCIANKKFPPHIKIKSFAQITIKVRSNNIQVTWNKQQNKSNHQISHLDPGIYNKQTKMTIPQRLSIIKLCQ